MKFKEGSVVEVFKRNEGQYGGWFSATVLSGNRHKYTVRYKLLLTAEGKPIVETVDDEDVRPEPPSGNGKERWITGELAEVFDQVSWRMGKIAKVLKNGCAVMKLFGSIQLKQFHTTNLRIPQAWRENQWIVTNKENSEQVVHGYTTNNDKQIVSGALGRENRIAKNTKQNRLDYRSPVVTAKRNLSTYNGENPDDIAKGTCKKRKGNSKENGSHHMKKTALPKKVDAISFPKFSVAEKFLHMSSQGPKIKNSYMKNNRSSKSNRTIDNQAGYSHSIPVQVFEENIECSVASCSGNQFPGCSNTENRHRLKNTGSKLFDDAMSWCPSDNGNNNQSISAEELAASIHELELHAYQTTMQALYASGPLSWEQESLLTNLRLCLNISNEEHLLQLRHLLSV